MKKTELFELYKEEKREGTIDTVILYIHMPTGEDEVIVNPNVKDKMEYIDRTYLTASEHVEFSLFRSKRNDILVRGTENGCNIYGELYEEIISRGYDWIAHSHPDGGNLRESEDDRKTLRKLGQKKSVLVGIDGEEKEYSSSVFDA